MCGPDEEHNAFMISRGLHCYKKCGNNIQRLMNKMFTEQIGKMMELYIEDVLVKSLQVANHLKHLEEAFSVLQKYRMKLSPLKCAFEVKYESFSDIWSISKGSN